MAAPDLPACVTLWVGDGLSALERACMRSVLAQGHHLTLYTYGPLAGVPDGVEVADAAQVLPPETIIAHRSGSLALFSDRFRYALQKRGAGIWVDADVYLLAPLELPADGYLFGWSEPHAIGAGVLALPPHSPIIAPVLQLFDDPYVPDWLTLPNRVRAHWRRWRTGAVRVEELPWGTAGPLALTALARRYDLLGHALPSHVFYPYGWHEAGWVFDPARSVGEFVRPGTRALHLYNYLIASRKVQSAEPGSFMARLQSEGV